KDYHQWRDDLIAWQPHVIVLESTTPVMKFYWALTEELRRHLPQAVIVMTGYHSSRAPEETLQHSATDVVVRSNHVDFILRRLIGAIAASPGWRESTDIEGLAIRTDGGMRSTGNFIQVEPLDDAPLVDRDLVQWRNYAYENGNFLQTPGTYATSVIRDCMFGKCTFCRYNGPDLTFSQMSVERSLDEYERLITDYGVREIFDDSGVWYRGLQARQFAEGIIARGLHTRGCYFGFNTRFEYLDEQTIRLLAKANFRFVLLGFEAADDYTLQRLNKGYQMQHVESCLRLMTKYGLHPPLTIMVGYFWQTQEMLDLTVTTVKRLMTQGYARTLQVTICTPLDYTPYHRECLAEGVLLTEDYNDHDMSKVIVRTPIPHERYYAAIREMYGIAYSPAFILRQLTFLLRFTKREWQFVFSYGVRALRRVRQHRYNLTRGEAASAVAADPKSLVGASRV
ncbi:MAG: radical SAM protein, partial [Actinomycetales bacterium]|nr:radical SAM protein [Actinomycetales bacterium]